MILMPDKKNEKASFDRPLGCGECKKPIAFVYTEIADGIITKHSMCADCPELLFRLHGTNRTDLADSQMEAVAGLACGNCGTTLEQVKRGHLLGCAECYGVFEDVLLNEMQQSNRIPERLLPIKKTSPIHMGRSRGEEQVLSPSSRLLALNEALKETLHREDYEQAARLRDQIKALTEKTEETSHEPSG